MGTGIGNCTDIGACHNTFCCNTICLLAEIWIGTVLLSSILYIYSCIFTKREKGMKVHRKVRLYEKKLILLIFSLFVLLICSESYFYIMSKTSVYKGYKQDKIEMRGDRAEMSDFPLYLNTVAGGLDCRDQTIGGFSFVVKIYAVPVVEIIG